MGIFKVVLSFLGLSKEMSEGAIARAAKTLSNPYTQTESRQEQMEKLIRDGSQPAIRALLRRLTATATQGISDEDEKRQVVSALAEMGDKAIIPLREYISREHNLTHAIEALRQIMNNPPQFTAALIEALRAHGPHDYRSTEQKLQIILTLCELAESGEAAQVIPVLTEYVDDHSDDVRFSVVRALFKHAAITTQIPTFTALLGELSNLLTSEKSSLRIARQLAEGFATTQWPLSETQSNALPPALMNEFEISAQKVIKK